MSLVIFIVGSPVFCFFLFRFDEEEQLYHPLPQGHQSTRQQQLLPGRKSEQGGDQQQQPAIRRQTGEGQPKGSASEAAAAEGAFLIQAPAGV